MSLDIYLGSAMCPTCGHHDVIFEANITHNLVPMWKEAGIYDALYNSEGQTAESILPILKLGLEAMREDPVRFEKLNASNGWGLYSNALPWLYRLIDECRKYPFAIVTVSK